MNKIICCFVISAIALFSCQTGLANENLTAQDWLQKGTELEKQHVYEEAIKMYTTAVMIDKNYSEAYFKRAKAYMASHKTFAMEALTDFNKAIDLNPTNAEAYYERGLLHAFILNNEYARDDMRTAANLGHKGAQTWLVPHPKDNGSEKKSTDMRAAAANRDDASQSRSAGEGGKSKEQAGTDLDLAGYLSSKTTPIVHFDFDMSTIKEQYYAILDEIALVLQEKIPEANILLAGHTDSTGTEKYNDKLSLRRAKAVESYLTVEHGIPHGRFTVRGYGESAPIATNETEEGQAKNRRVELRVARK
jgi:outer membrane protein OmpA-like peptidoglycan-associated protein